MMLEGKTVIVTGVGGGLGRECVTSALREGANVVLAARTQQTLDDVASALDPDGTRTATVVTDINDADRATRLEVAVVVLILLELIAAVIEIARH